MTKEAASKEIFSTNFVIGGIAGICGKTIIAPIERIKYIFVVEVTRRQTEGSALRPAGPRLATSSRKRGFSDSGEET